MKKLLTIGVDATAPVRRNPTTTRLSPAETRLLTTLARARGWVPLAKLQFADATRSALMVRGYVVMRLNGPGAALGITPAGRAAIDGSGVRKNPTPKRRKAAPARRTGVWVA